MVIRKVHIDGYGCLENVEIEFSHSLNMIYGLNESGKTTLKRCILALLFGQESVVEFTGLKNENELMRPWSGAPYSASLSYSLSDGRTFTVYRDFEMGQVSIIDEQTDEDITDTIPIGEKGQLLLIPEHLDLNLRNIFSTALIQQDQMTELKDARALSETIMNLADSASREHQYLKALQSLESAIREIGDEQRADTPLGKATATLKASEVLSSKSEDQKEAIEEMQARIDTLHEQVDKFRGEYKKFNYIYKSCQLEKISQDIQEVENLDREITEIENKLEQAKVATSITLKDVTKLHTLRSQLEKAREELSRVEKRREEMMEQYRNIREELSEKEKLLQTDPEILQMVQLGEGQDSDSVLRTKEKMLEEAREKEKTVREEFQEKHKIFSGFRDAEEFDNVVSGLENKLAKQEILKIKESEIERLNLEISGFKRSLRHRFLIAILVIVAGGAVSFYSFMQGLSFALKSNNLLFGMGLALIAYGVLYWLSTFRIRREMEISEQNLQVKEQEVKTLKDTIASAQIKLKEMFKKLGALSTEELRRKYRDYIRTRVDLETAVNLTKTLEREIQTLSANYVESADLKELLQELGFVPADGEITAEAVTTFRMEYNKARELQEKSEQMRQEYEKLLDEKKEVEKEVRELENSIQEILTRDGVSSIQAYDQAYEFSRQSDQLKMKLEAKRERRNNIAGDQPVEKLYERKRQLTIARDMLKSENPEFGTLNLEEYEMEEAKEKFEDYGKKISASRSEIDSLQFKIDTIMSLASGAAGSEELEQAKKEREKLLKHKRALEIARDIVEETGGEFRDKYFAPQLSRETARLISLITGKYDEVEIDRDLNILVKSPEKDEMVTTENLSRATIEQLYLTLRLGIAMTLSRERESFPLIMDDPFLKFDQERGKKAFGSLIELEDIHQIIFFTCSPRQKKVFAIVLKEHDQIAKLSHVGKMELIKPAATRDSTSTVIMQLPK